ncbi:glycosyltransferase [bacterium]|nr:glycosyltransferase [bacterium]
MRFVMFYQSLVSDWNHGNAHFLRGVATELLSRGHEVSVYEPRDSWCVRNLFETCGEASGLFHSAYPHLGSTRYDPGALDLDEALEGADVVIVHEWNDHELVGRIGRHRAGRASYTLFFHDTHHRSVTEPWNMASYDLSGYDGVLAFGEAVKEVYVERGWARRVWTWHEAADVRVFRPRPFRGKKGDLVWIGNWGDDERTAELGEFLLGPVKNLGLKARAHGVRYPERALKLLGEAGIEYGGWLPNFEAPAVFASFMCTVHVPRRPYAEMLPGIPTIRVFEALSCGIPLVSAPWEDSEGLFRPGKDFLVARNGMEMARLLKELLNDAGMRDELARNGMETVLMRHTCANRVDELLAIYSEINMTAGV